MRIQTVDVGSSSVKLALYEIFRRNAHASPVRSTTAPIEDIGVEAAASATVEHIARAGAPNVFSHRIVYGTHKYAAPVAATAQIMNDLQEAFALEPLHLPLQVAIVCKLQERFPQIPQVLCFDTAFHRRMPPIAQRSPLPASLGPVTQRCGYHGLSYEYVSSVLGEMRGRMVIAHLGSGSSLCALRDGRPVDTTMSFSPLGGLMMATRPGDLDPGIVLYLMQHSQMSVQQLTDLFYRKSGLLGVSGKTGDMKELLDLAPHDSAAREAVELYVYQLRKHLGAMAATLGGIDSLVFTGGIGENSPEIRAALCEKLGYLGVNLVGDFNQKGDAIISANASGVTVWVVHTNESLMLARHAFDVMESVSTVA